MAKKSKNFDFTIPVPESAVVNGRLSVINHGDVEVTGTYDDAENFDYDSITWQGLNLLPLLENFPGTDRMREEIDDAVRNHMAEQEPIPTEPADDRKETVDLMYGLFQPKF